MAASPQTWATEPETRSASSLRGHGLQIFAQLIPQNLPGLDQNRIALHEGGEVGLNALAAVRLPVGREQFGHGDSNPGGHALEVPFVQRNDALNRSLPEGGLT